MKATGEPPVQSPTRDQIYFQMILGTLTGLAHTGCLALIGVLLPPVLFARLGPTGYGKWIFLISLTSYLYLFELGLGTALAKLWGECKSALDLLRLRSGLATASVLFGVVGVLAVAATCIATVVWPDTISLLPYFAVGTVLTFWGEPMAGVLRGLQRPHWVNLINTASAALNAGLILWLLLAGWGLTAAAAALVVSAAWRLVALAVLLRKAVPGGQLLGRPTWNALRDMLSLGATDQITRIWVVAISPTNRAILYGVLGSSVLAAYDLGARLVSVTALIPAVMLPTLLPAFTRLARDNDAAAIDRLLCRATRYISLIGLPICWFLLLFADPLAEAWLHRASPDVALATRILLLGAFLNLLTGPFTAALLGLGRPALCIQKVLFGCFLGLLFPIALATTLGLLGFLVGESLAAALPAIMFLLKFSGATGIETSGAIGRGVCRIMLMLMPAGALALFVYRATMTNSAWQSLSTWFLLFFAFLTCALVLYRFTGLLTTEETGKIFDALGAHRLLLRSPHRIGQ